MTISAVSAATPPGVAADRFLERLDEIRRGVDAELSALLGRRSAAAAREEGGPGGLPELLGSLEAFVANGGKRLRPAFVLAAYRACGGRSQHEAMPLALATELLHTYLLIHDDIMDHAELRRGMATAHVTFRERHAARGLRGDAADFGRSVAILLGDLAYSLAAELFGQTLLDAAEAGRPGLARLQASFAAMCQEVIGGQYLELSLAERPAEERPLTPAVERELLRVLRLKSGRYTAERPLELGALLAGAAPEVLAELSRYGTAVGEAFQLQDDLLGIFGEAERVGKPVGSDLQEGKFTLLVYHALRRATADQRSVLESALGNPGLDAAAAGRAIRAIEETGARRAVVALVDERLGQARQALARLDGRLEPEGARFLADILDHLKGRET